MSTLRIPFPTCSRESRDLQSVFVGDDIEPIVIKCIEETVGGAASYEDSSMPKFTNMICEDVLASLAELKKPFKYAGVSSRAVGDESLMMHRAESFKSGVHIKLAEDNHRSVLNPKLPQSMSAVTCIITQSVGAGMNVAVREHCDPVRDSIVVVKWPPGEGAGRSSSSSSSSSSAAAAAAAAAGGEGPGVSVIVTVFGAALHTGDR